MKTSNLTGGVSFESLKGGKVKISINDGHGRQAIAVAHPQEWAQVLADMSSRGVDEALSFHLDQKSLEDLRSEEENEAAKVEADAKQAAVEAMQASERAAAANARVHKNRRVRGKGK